MQFQPQCINLLVDANFVVLVFLVSCVDVVNDAVLPASLCDAGRFSLLNEGFVP